MILPLGSAGVLKYLSGQIGQPLTLLIVVPFVVGLLQYAIVPCFVHVTNGWMLQPHSPNVRCEPLRTLEHGLCCFRPDDLSANLTQLQT